MVEVVHVSWFCEYSVLAYQRQCRVATLDGEKTGDRARAGAASGLEMHQWRRVRICDRREIVNRANVRVRDAK